MSDNGYYSTKQAAEILRVPQGTIAYHCYSGVIPAGKNGKGSSRPHGFKIAWLDLVEYWRTKHEARCMRCTIMGEATPELGFLCGPCAYEVETGRIWWPRLPRRTTYGVPTGKLSFPLGVAVVLGR